MAFIQFGTDKKVVEKLVTLEARVRRIEEEIDWVMAQPQTKEILSKINEIVELVKSIKLPAQ